MSNQTSSNIALDKDLFILSDESNPQTADKKKIRPSTSIDQVYDPLDPMKKTLRQIIEDLKLEIMNGGIGDIVFPVTTVNGRTGDVTITAKDIGLDQVDNTRDINKPLSTPQREAIMDILDRYDFNIDLSDLYSHIEDHGNPHAVTVDQINKDNELEHFVAKLIQNHNLSNLATTHADIRRGISGLWNAITSMDDKVQQITNDAFASVYQHFTDTNAHGELFDLKQNISERVNALSDGSSTASKQYPTAKAVMDYVITKINEFNKTLPDIDDWIEDIRVVDKRSELPNAGSSSHRHVYIIRYSDTSSHGEIAICRKRASGIGYEWEYYDTAPYTKWDPDHFTDSARGLAINISFLIKSMMVDQTLVDSLHDIIDEYLPGALGDQYYKKDEIDQRHYIGSIAFVPGTQDGTFRFYIDDDRFTMSEDCKIAGLQRIAFMEYVTEDEIYDNAVHSNHILNKAIETRHLNDKIIGANHMTAQIGTVFGNLNNSDGTVKELTLYELANALVPYLVGKV